MTAHRATLTGLILLLTQPLAHAAELRVWTARAGTTVLEEIGPEFERSTATSAASRRICLIHS